MATSVSEVDTTEMYRIATALNHKGNRRKLGYGGPDQFLTNVGGKLMMMPESSSPGQKWRLTGENCLLNGTGLYLTACKGKELQFLPRDHKNNGQIWVPDWHPTSALYADYALNIYGGRNGEGKTVGLYLRSRSPNEEWRNAETDAPLGTPKCIDIQYHTHLAEFTKEPGAMEFVAGAESANYLPVQNPCEAQFSKKCISETYTEHNFNITFGTKFSQSFKGGAGLPFVCKGEGETKWEMNLDMSYGHTTGTKTGEETSSTFKTTYYVPPFSKVKFSMLAMKAECRVPYTMIFDDGSTIESFIFHKESLNINYETKIVEKLPGYKEHYKVEA